MSELDENDPVQHILEPGVIRPIRTVIHSLSCTEQTQKWQEEHAAYIKDYPNYCKKCNGSGVLMAGGDWVPYGSSGARLPTYPEPCEHCFGHCPRCYEWIYSEPPPDPNDLWVAISNEDDATPQGRRDRMDKWNDLVEAWYVEENECPHCNWRWGKRVGDLLPEPPECYCWDN